jgi:hypothetical protein
MTKDRISTVTRSIPYNFKPKNWYHIAATYSEGSGSLKVYINGELRQEFAESSPILYYFGETLIGGLDTPGNSFNGIIDELAVYNEELKASEIKGHCLMGQVR